MKTITAQKMRKVIIIAAAAAQVFTVATVLQAAEPCRPDGFCPLPNKAADLKAALRVETRRAALKNMLRKQFDRCDTFVNKKLTLGQVKMLHEQIIIKAWESGLLLQLPDIVREVASKAEEHGHQFCCSTLYSSQNALVSKNIISSES